MTVTRRLTPAQAKLRYIRMLLAEDTYLVDPLVDRMLGEELSAAEIAEAQEANLVRAREQVQRRRVKMARKRADVTGKFSAVTKP